MGVHDLWPILEPVGQLISIEDLAGQKVAVDLACWVVQAKQCKGLNFSRKPHLKNLFYRVSRLLTNGIIPVFITEGPAPDLKKSTIKERKIAACAKTGDFGYEADSSRSSFDQVLVECQEMLESLGVPCLKSSGEAEALCAFLNRKGLVDGCITEDNDAFLYGAHTVYRDFSADPKDPHVTRYLMEDIENKLQLDREKLVALALLLGCDYGKGVPGVGKDTALKCLVELKTADILQRFKEWKNMPECELFPNYNSSLDKQYIPHCEKCGHPGSATKHKSIGCDLCESDFCCYSQNKEYHHCLCDWHKNLEVKINMKNELKVYQSVQGIRNFPNQKVIDEFLSYTDEVPDVNVLDWSEPKLPSFQEGAMDWLRWTIADSLPKFLPIVSSWQIFQLLRTPCTHEDEFMFHPVGILAERTKNGKVYYEVRWESKDNLHRGIDLCTYEKIGLFSEAYRNLTKKFNNDTQLKKVERRKVSKKTLKPKFKSSSQCQDIKTFCAVQTELKNDMLHSFEAEDLFPHEGLASGSNTIVGNLEVDSFPELHSEKRPAELANVPHAKYFRAETGEQFIADKTVNMY